MTNKFVRIEVKEWDVRKTVYLPILRIMMKKELNRLGLIQPVT